MKKHVTKGEKCLNCQQELDGENFCPNCGQLNNISKPTLGQLLMDALSNLFAFDSKFYLSIWPLLVRPGKLSLDVVQGKKTSYLPPIRLFVLIVVIMLGLNSVTERVNRSWSDTAHLKKSKSPLFVSGKDTSSNENELHLTFDNDESGNHYEKMYEHAIKHPDLPTSEGLKELNVDATFLNTFFYSSFLKLANMNSEQFTNYISSNLLIILLLFIPVLAFILKAMYFYKQDYYYVDHFIFSLHTQTAFFVFIILQIILSWLIGNFSYAFLFIGFAIYLFIALKNFYQQRALFTFFNFVLVNTSFVIVSIIFMLVVSLVSFILI